VTSLSTTAESASINKPSGCAKEEDGISLRDSIDSSIATSNSQNPPAKLQIKTSAENLGGSYKRVKTELVKLAAFCQGKSRAHSA
jgi:hypothetical protein